MSKHLPKAQGGAVTLFFIAVFGVFIGGCSSVPISPGGSPNSLEPRGPFAANIAELWWIMFGLGTAVFILILGILLYMLFIRKPRIEPTDDVTFDRDGTRWIVLGGIVMPLIVLAIVFVFTTRSVSVLGSEPTTLTIEVIGRRWWWEVHYPEQGIVTANEIHIPVGVPVHLTLESGDVIHSFWVPQLHGKMDMIPGRVNFLQIQADEPGIYRGECAEYCGLQHAHMQFMMVAQEQEDFDAWLANQQQPAAEPRDELVQRGQQVFLEAGCVYCHTIRGFDVRMIDPSAVDIGPDLTHLASRLTIGAGMLNNNRGNLGGWIVNPQHLKPGVLMPANPMNGDDLQALLVYLETLQ